LGEFLQAQVDREALNQVFSGIKPFLMFHAAGNHGLPMELDIYF